MAWSVLVLLPVLAISLYYPGSYAVVVIAASMVSLTVVGVAVHSSEATNLRRLVLWTAVSVVVSVTIHRLRDTLEGQVRDSAELARLGRLMNGATQSLTSLHDPKEVISEGTLVMAELAGPGFNRVSYLRVRDDVVVQEALADERGSVPASCLLKDDPYVSEVLATKKPLVAKLDRAAMGPTLRSIVDEVRHHACGLRPDRPDRPAPRHRLASRAGARPSPTRSWPAAAPWATSSSSRSPTRWPTTSSRSRPTPIR